MVRRSKGHSEEFEGRGELAPSRWPCPPVKRIRQLTALRGAALCGAVAARDDCYGTCRSASSEVWHQRRYNATGATAAVTGTCEEQRQQVQQQRRRQTQMLPCSPGCQGRGQFFRMCAWQCRICTAPPLLITCPRPCACLRCRTGATPHGLQFRALMRIDLAVVQPSPSTSTQCAGGTPICIAESYVQHGHSPIHIGHHNRKYQRRLPSLRVAHHELILRSYHHRVKKIKVALAVIDTL